MRLRHWQLEDAATLLDLYQQVEDLRRQMPALYSLEDARELVSQELLPANGRAIFALEHQGKAAGLVGLRFSATDDKGNWDRGWVFYWSAPSIRGLGAIKTAVKAVCDWALGEWDGSAQRTLKEGQLDVSLLSDSKTPALRRLELGYRTNNPASGAVAAAAGFMVEGIEREKFLYAGKPGRNLAAVHHIELWTADYKASAPSWDWLLRNLGWKEQDTWHLGKSWRAADASYLVLEQSSDVNGQHDRMRAGLNHLALNCMSRQELDHIRAEAPEHGWAELFADRYPHAGGNQHTALYLENAEGFEVELVV